MALRSVCWRAGKSRAPPTNNFRLFCIPCIPAIADMRARSEEHTSELQSHLNLVCRLLLEKKKNTTDFAPVSETEGDDTLDDITKGNCRIMNPPTTLLQQPPQHLQTVLINTHHAPPCHLTA